MTINQNTFPYWNDFDEAKNFHQILFKPGTPVQSRELTQIQSILADQIAKFGKHIFKHGSVVIPGNIFADLFSPYVKLASLTPTQQTSLSSLEDKIVIGQTSGIRASVRVIAPATSVDPATIYVSYLSGGDTSNVFLPDENIFAEDDPAKSVTVASINPTGFGTVAYIKKGVYFVNGYFVTVNDQKAVVSKYSSVPSARIGLKISETAVSHEEDETLLDPAQGSYNFSAPGADRLKITLTLSTLPVSDVITDEFIELIRYNNGVLEKNVRFSEYSELEKNLARRTFDESGDYMVNGFETFIRESLRTPYNNGVSDDGDAGKFVIEVNPGKAYINGNEVESLSRKSIELNKARTADHIKSGKFSGQTSYGRYIYVSGLQSQPNYEKRELVNIFTTSSISGGSAVGTLRVLGIDYVAGDPESVNAIYRLYIDDLVIDQGFKLINAGGISFNGGSARIVHKYLVPSATVDFQPGELVNTQGSTRSGVVANYFRNSGVAYIYRNDNTKVLPVNGDSITGANSTGIASINGIESLVINSSPSIFELPKNYIKSIEGSTNYDISYTVWKTLTLVTNGSGNASQTITNGKFRNPEVGVTVAAGPGGVLPFSTLSVENENTFKITAGPINTTVVVLTQVVKNAGLNVSSQPRLKTLATATLTNVIPTQQINLGKADIYRIISITSAGLDVSDRYKLDNGQTDYYYGLGKLDLVRELPPANLTIVFEYFQHSGSGDFFSIDSYKTLGLANDLYVSKAPTYTSKTSSRNFLLGNCLDFRPTIGSTGSFESGGADTIDTPVVDEFFSTTVQYYVPRIDVVYLDQKGDIKVAAGVPDEVPTEPTTPDSTIQITKMFVNSYTESLSQILNRPTKLYRYQMKDIGKLEKRITNLEYYTQLNALETSIVTQGVVDAETGIDRFKSGYVVDNFEIYNLVCDYFNSKNRCTFFNGNLGPAVEDSEAIMFLSANSTNYHIENGFLSLQYTEVPFVKQNQSSRVENLNPFLVVNWEGNMTINPSQDIWVESRNLPTILNTAEEVVEVEVIREIQCPPPPPVWNPPPPPVDYSYSSYTPSYVEPPPPPAKEPTGIVPAFAKDIGLVDLSNPNDPNWDAVVYLELPLSVATSVNSTAQTWINEYNSSGSFAGFQDSTSWANTIVAVNNALSSVTNISSSNGATFDLSSNRLDSNTIINFWQSTL